jgi:glycosyltransferase involved in cell wall biosynthesis
MLSVIIPAFNEAENLEKNVPNLVKYLNSKKIRYELLVSEDGSDDGTQELLKRFSEIYGITHIHNERRLGKGGGLKRAASAVKYEKVIFIDADMPIKIDSFETMIDDLERNDVVIGSRYVKGHESRTERTFKRLLLSKAFHLLVKIMFPELKVSDTQCGFKGFKKDVFVSVNRKTKVNDWSWDVEFLVRASKEGYKIKEIPIEWKESSQTRVNLFVNIFSQFINVLVIRLRTIF